ncbi:hypothetical protein [Fusobacterium hwasookii]|nr:hypothetical protein [Fusobacterium hwasookii]
MAFGLTAGSLLLPIVIIYFLIIFNSVRKNLNKKQTNMKTYLKEEICN